MLRRKYREVNYFFSTHKKVLDNGKTITYKLNFIDNFRFMPTSLSRLVDTLSEIYKNECKVCRERRKIKSLCNFIGLKNKKINYDFKECKKKMVQASKWVN